jgi:hypothetical protein
MKKLIDFKILIIFIILSQMQIQTESLGFDVLSKLVSTTICGALSANQLSHCSNKFEEEIQSYKQSNDDYNKRGICCAINHLKECIIDAIGEKCGSNQKESADAVVSAFLSTFKLMAFSDRCDAFPYGSPLCYSDLILILIGIGFIVLLLSSICLIVKLCRCCCRKSSNYRYSSATVMLIPVENNRNNLP